MKADKINVLGTGICVLNMTSALHAIKNCLQQEHAAGNYVCVTGVHGVMEGLRDPDIRRIHNQAALCLPDGMPLVWIGRMRGHREIGRVYGPDLMLRLLCLAAENGYTNYFYGGNEGVADELGVRMLRRFPALKVAGAYCPPFRPLTETEESEIIAGINKVKPDILWVGLSTPKQEKLMYFLREKVHAGIMIGVGAAFDFLTGRLRQAPVWMRKAGLEWFFRLCMEPRRLAGRYLRNNPAFLLHIFLQTAGFRGYPQE